MEHVETHHTNETSPTESDEAAPSGRSAVARRTRKGEAPGLVTGYSNHIGRGGLLTKREESTLAHLARAGDGRARSRLVEKNLGLVISVARPYRGIGLPFEDLVQEGNLGLIKAVEKFDPEMGNRFSTYATWWIKQSIRRALSDKGRIIRLPVHTGEQVRTLVRTRNELSADLGREPSNGEVAERLGWTARKVDTFISLIPDATSLNRPTGAESGASELGESIEDERTSGTPEAVIQEMEDSWLRQSLQEMPDRERRVLVRRYGLDGQEPTTLAEMSAELGVSRERVRQLQHNAQRRLRRGFAPKGGSEQSFRNRADQETEAHPRRGFSG